MIKIDVRTHFRTGRPCPQLVVDSSPVTPPLKCLEDCLFFIFKKASGEGDEDYCILYQIDEPLELGDVDLRGRLKYESRRYEELLGPAFEFHNKLLYGLEVPERD
tara:strand:- start:55 stop:369 length:315 start_codon:yes stop_codon:yes gene_type:complete